MGGKGGKGGKGAGTYCRLFVLLNGGRAGRKRTGWAGMAGRVLEAVIL